MYNSSWHTYICIHMFVCVCIYMYTYTYIYIYTYLHSHTFLHRYTHLCVCVCVCVYAHFVCLCECQASHGFVLICFHLHVFFRAMIVHGCENGNVQLLKVITPQSCLSLYEIKWRYAIEYWPCGDDLEWRTVLPCDVMWDHNCIIVVWHHNSSVTTFMTFLLSTWRGQKLSSYWDVVVSLGSLFP